MVHTRLRVLVKGIVQGVGFRPFVYSLAQSLSLKGFVMNSSEGVVIEIEGEKSPLFAERFRADAPPLSQIMDIEIIPLPSYGYQDFQILESNDEGSFTLISADVSLCDDCFKELLDKNNRRYLYPFINCTNCGPRYTITESLPYDRPHTTMSVFEMCTDCESEYHDPGNRRFHAQPNACPVCGPQVELIMRKGKNSSLQKDTKNPVQRLAGDKTLSNPIEKTIALLKEGKIVAIKGLGGFHIACDASNEQAVDRLRLKKRNSNKPFALMAPDIQTARKFCEVSQEEELLLTSKKRPIVLLNKIGNSLPEAVSPHNPYFGVMLPYTPLHYLLFYYPSTNTSSRSGQDNKNSCIHDSHCHEPAHQAPYFDALVMTSGNISEEPIVIDNEEALVKLSRTADAFLVHNRDIFMRVDDSVIRLLCVKPDSSTGIEPSAHLSCAPSYREANPSKPCHLSFIRRSRGYVPDPVFFSDDGPDVLGCGADIKNTFTLTKDQFAIPSQHIGDLENYETLTFFEESLRNLKEVYRVKPVALAYDLHPHYLSTQWALKQEGIRKFAIQHHHAHIASVMAEKGMKGKVIGVSLDGSGYGPDRRLWGGEFLIADITGFKRAGHFKYIPLPGGEMSIKEPWRITISYLKNIAGADTKDYLKSIGFIDKYGEKKIEDILKIVDIRTYSPLSSGAGRLFDAVAALIGICDRNTFEGEAAIALESLTLPDIREDYPCDIKFRDVMEIDFSQTIVYILKDLLKGEHKGMISSKFHNTVISAIVRVVQKLSSMNMITDVVLCGGVFQNMYLLEKTLVQLQSIGMNVYINDKVPSNDAGISLGQAYIIRELLKRESYIADRKNS